MKTEAIKKTGIKKDFAHYLSLPYTTVLRRDDAGDVIARIEELPGCIAHGQNEVAALANLESMKQMWIEDCLESGDHIPEPEKHEALPSGKWVQRVPRSLHAQLVKMAKADEVSLNQFVTSMLSQQIGAKAAGRKKQRQSH
jgi:antitoxin HicB